MRLHRRSVLAAALAPLSVPLLFAITFVLSSGSASLGWTVFAFLTASLISYAGLVFIGMPLVWLLERIEMLNLWTILLAGVIGGATYTAIIEFVFDYSPESAETFGVGSVVFGAVCGFLVALTFGLIAGARLSSLPTEDT